MTKILLYTHLGGAASSYCMRLARVLTGYDVVGADLPGCGSRHAEPPLCDLVSAAAQEAHRLRREEQPIIVFGHSLGALVAYEVARHREAMGFPVAGLITSGRGSPDNAPDPLAASRSDAEILEYLGRVGATPAAILADMDLITFYLPALRAGFRMLESYRYAPQPRLGCPLLILSGTDDSLVDDVGIVGWRRCVDGPISNFRMPGGHMFPLSADAT